LLLYWLCLLLLFFASLSLSLSLLLSGVGRGTEKNGVFLPVFLVFIHADKRQQDTKHSVVDDMDETTITTWT
jgi:hypothetical protein